MSETNNDLLPGLRDRRAELLIERARIDGALAEVADLIERIEGGPARRKRGRPVAVVVPTDGGDAA